MKTHIILGIVLLVTVSSGRIAFAETRQEQQANSELELMAKDIAQLCATPGFRGFLRSEMAKTKNAEGIVELDRFLERASKQNNMPPGLNQVTQKVKDAKGRHKAMNLTGLTGFDLYIPVDAHRKKWKGGKDFIVAVAPYGNEKEMKQTVGFSVKDGKKVFLDTNRLPDTVVLVVAPEEHLNHDVPRPAPNDPAMNAPHIENPKPGAGEGEEHYSYFHMSYIRIQDEHEPWTSGDPEIYLLAGQICDGNAKGYMFDLARVNNKDKVYYIKDLNKMHFSDKCSWDTHYSVWERDGSGGGVFMSTNNGTRITPRLNCYPDPSCTSKYVTSLFRGNKDDPVHTYQPKTHAHKMLGKWEVNNYDSYYSDSSTTYAKFYKKH